MFIIVGNYQQGKLLLLLFFVFVFVVGFVVVINVTVMGNYVDFQDPNSVDHIQQLYFRPQAYNMFCGFFKNKWTEKINFEEKLEHCLVWPPMKSFLEISSK